MKKLWVLAILLAAIFSFSSCSKEEIVSDVVIEEDEDAIEEEDTADVAEEKTVIAETPVPVIEKTPLPVSFPEDTQNELIQAIQKEFAKGCEAE